MITIELIEPFPAWAKLYTKMMKQFGQEYTGTLKGAGLKRRELTELAMSDINKKNVWWIVLDGRKIGFINSPNMVDDQGVFKYKYLDTRWIMPEYRQQGYGSQALKLLQDQHYVSCVKIKTDYMSKNWSYWHQRGYGHAVLAGQIDEAHREELQALKNRERFEQQYQMDDHQYWSMFNWYLLDSHGEQHKKLEEANAPILIECEQFFGRATPDETLTERISDCVEARINR